MWRWPSIPMTLLQNIKLFQSRPLAAAFFLISLFLISPFLIYPLDDCYAAPTSLGPTSPEEAQILWKEGQQSYKESRFQDAVNQLGRYVDRYPGSSGFTEAHFLLGKSYFELKRTPEALKAFKYYLNSKGITSDSAEARVWLGRSYLKLKKFEEALQVSRELERTKPQLTPPITLWKYLIQSRALVGLGHETRAGNAIEVAEHDISDTTSKEVIGQIFAIKLQVKVMSCRHLQTWVPLTENQALSLNDRRGTCLLEALLIFNKVLKTESPSATAEAATQLIQAFEAYQIACKHPAPPKPTPGHRRTAQELKSYSAELSEFLLKNYQSNTRRALELLDSWKPVASSPLNDSFNLVFSRLKQTLSRTL
jgi:tetratricopeptide (TPR) repeat protein